MARLDWFTARPVAHRGLHDESRGIVENTPSAFADAVAAGYAIECDIQVAADGEAMVFHDDTLERLTEGSGPVAALSSGALKAIPYKGTADRMPTLSELCELVGGRTTLVIELKSRNDGDTLIVRRAVDVLSRYAGPFGVMSFDPFLIKTLRRMAPQLLRGLVAESSFEDAGGHRAAYLRDVITARPQFIAYNVKDLPAAGTWIARHVFGMPILTWTVRTPEDRRAADRWADQIIFEGLRP